MPACLWPGRAGAISHRGEPEYDAAPLLRGRWRVEQGRRVVVVLARRGPDGGVVQKRWFAMDTRTSWTERSLEDLCWEAALRALDVAWATACSAARRVNHWTGGAFWRRWPPLAHHEDTTTIQDHHYAAYAAYATRLGASRLRRRQLQSLRPTRRARPATAPTRPNRYAAPQTRLRPRTDHSDDVALAPARGCAAGSTGGSTRANELPEPRRCTSDAKMPTCAT